MPAIIYKNEEGKGVPSFSTIEREWGSEKAERLKWWAWKKGEAGESLYEKKEADVGTLAHMMIDYETKNKKLDLSEFGMEIITKAKVCYSNWEQWKLQNDFQPIATEVSLVSEKHQWGGTPDCIALINKKLSLLDVKTGKDVYESHLIQIASYENLWEENFPDKPLVGGCHIIRTGDEIAMFAHHWYGRHELRLAWKMFKKLREIYDLGKEVKKLK